MGWHKWVGSKGRVLGIDRYGASAPASQVFENLGLTANHAVEIANKMLHG
jgi:transketolase